MPAPNTVPSLNMQTFSGTENTDYIGTVVATDADGDTLTYSLVADGSQGSVITLNASSGAFTYRPTANTHGADHFNISVNDGHGGVSTAVMTINVANVNSAPAAHDDRATFATGATMDVDVLANDTDADSDALTVTVLGTPLVGTATVRPDKKIRFTGLPTDFRGMTRVQYQVSDPDGETSTATAVVFVDTTPFAAVFGRDATGGGYEIAVADFGSAEPRALDLQLTGGKALRSFLPSKDGRFVAFTRGVAPGFASLEACVIATTVGATPTCHAYPVGTVAPVFDPDSPPLAISDDGKWVAFSVQRPDSTLVQSLYVIDTAAPQTLIPVPLANNFTVVYPMFSVDSSFLYFGARDNQSTGLVTSFMQLLRVPTNDFTAPVLLEDVSGTNEIRSYYVADNDDLVVMQLANNSQYVKVDTASPMIEVALSGSAGAMAFAQPKVTGHIHGNIFAFGLSTSLEGEAYVSDLVGAPNTRLLFSFPTNGFGFPRMSVREDDAAVLLSYSNATIANAPVIEKLVDSATPPTQVGNGVFGAYAPGDRVVMQHRLTNAGTTRLTVAERASFGTPVDIGAGGEYAYTFTDLTDTSRGGVVYGATALTGTPTSSLATFANFAEPTKALSLGSVSTTTAGNLIGTRVWLVDQN